METVAVPGVACPCPGTPHPDGDTVELRARMGFAGGVELQQLVVQANASGVTTQAMVGLLFEGYLRLGIVAWTFTDKRGAVPVTAENIQRLILDDFTTATPIAEKANELYEGPVLGPLVNGAAKSSRTTTTARLTSARGSSSLRSPKRSARSSTSTTPTADTVATS